MKIDPKIIRNNKALEYSGNRGKKKKGAKIQMKPNLDSMPTSNVKVIGKSRATSKQIADAGLASRTSPAPRQPVKGKRGTAKTWGRKDSPN